MQTPREILADLWTLAGGDPAALDAVTLTGEEPQLPSSFRVATAAQAPIAATGLAAAEIWKLRGGEPQGVAVDMVHAVAECRSERYLRVDDKPPPPAWDPTAGIYRTRDRRFVRLHTNFPHHRAAVCKVLGCKQERDDIQAALMQWDGEAFETAAYAGGAVVALMRSHDEWSATPHAKALAAIPWLTIDTGRGKLTSLIELKSEEGRGKLRDLLAQADIFSQGYRPRAIASLGFSPEEAARISPGIISVSLSAYGHAGPWAERRGFDSLVQTTTGFNHAEGQAAGIDGPKELPAQMLDHATGYLMAFGAMMGRVRQSREGGSWHVRVSLAQTGRWLWNLGRVAGGLQTADLKGDAVRPFIEEMPSGFGRLQAVSHSAVLSKTPAFWARPAMPLGSHPPEWPARR
jgi:crotonobetainyl-CoA:carnitine CoA-transferase CaiB-like acyl-CoA transferase